MNPLKTPLNPQEEYLHGINSRLDRVIIQLDVLINLLAPKEEETVVLDVVPDVRPTTTTRKRK